MNKFSEITFKIFIQVLTIITFSILVFLFYFLISEAMPLFDYTSVKEFIFGTKWMPIEFGNNKTSFGIWYFILGTLYVSIVAIIIAVFLGIGISLFIAFEISESLRKNVFAIFDLISGIPSVVFGFFGLEVLSPMFFKFGVKTGNCILLASIVLSIMILPFIVNSLSYTFINEKNKYLETILNLGIDKWYAITTIILPNSINSIIISSVLANCRAMGETMAVMMVCGNAKIFPHLLSKGETISSLIALEMGTAVRNSPHYHALYAAGLVLLLLSFITNHLIRFVGKLRK